MDLVYTILYLNPEAKFAVHNCTKEQYQGESNPIEINGCLVDWNPVNTQPCPTLEQLEACDPADVNQYRITRLKQQRDQSYQNDINAQLLFKVAQVSTPSITFSEFLDQVYPIE